VWQRSAHVLRPVPRQAERVLRAPAGTVPLHAHQASARRAQPSEGSMEGEVVRPWGHAANVFSSSNMAWNMMNGGCEEWGRHRTVRIVWGPRGRYMGRALPEVQ